VGEATRQPKGVGEEYDVDVEDRLVGHYEYIKD